MLCALGILLKSVVQARWYSSFCKNKYMTFDVLTVAVMKISVLWDILLYRFGYRYQHCGGTCCFCPQDSARKICCVGKKLVLYRGVGKKGCLNSGPMGKGGGIEQCAWAIWKMQENG
jgi:hypothetical protein